MGKDFLELVPVQLYWQKRVARPSYRLVFMFLHNDTLILKGKIQNRKTFARWQVRGCCHVHIGEPWKLIKI